MVRPVSARIDVPSGRAEGLLQGNDACATLRLHQSASRPQWEEAREHGFVSAGGGSWYSGTLNQLSPGDRIWVRVPKEGYVGVGIVEGARVPLRDHVIDNRPAMEVLATVPPDTFENDPNRWEYIVPVRWLCTVPLEDAVHRTGMFGNQNTVAVPKTPAWRATVEQLKDVFLGWDGDAVG